MTATIIEFKPKNSTSYINLKNLFEITESIDACNFGNLSFSVVD